MTQITSLPPHLIQYRQQSRHMKRSNHNMNRFINFPASTIMTEFEIIEIQNEMIRQRKTEEGEKEEETSISSETEDESSDEDSYTMIDRQNIDLSEDDRASDLTEDEFMMDIPMDTSEFSEKQEENDINLENVMEMQSVTNNSDSNDSNQSLYKTPPNSISHLVENVQTQENKDQNLIGLNNIEFLEDLNRFNEEEGPIGSSIRMGYQSKLLNDFFICHICCRISWPEIGIIAIPEASDNKITAESIKKAAGKVSPITPPTHPRNIGAFVDHLIESHLNKQHVTDKANDNIEKIKKQIEQQCFSQFQYPHKIRKSASDSCMEARWKSNQPHLTSHMANHYSFGNRVCKGHTKQLHSRGEPYIIDLDQTVYCSCDAVPITPIIINGKEFPPPLPPRPVRHTIALGLSGTFFSKNKLSIFQMHKTIYCPYTIIARQPEPIPPYSIGVKTRSMTNTEMVKKNEDLEENKHPAPSFPMKNKNEKPLTEPREKTTGAKTTPLKKAAASALGLLKTTNPKKKANELSKL